jgi:hypothetical protein
MGEWRYAARGGSRSWVLIQFSSFQPAGKSNRVVAEQRANREICTFQFAECFSLRITLRASMFQSGRRAHAGEGFNSLLFLTKSWSPE